MLKAYFKEVLACAILTDGFANGRMTSDGIARLECLTAFEGDIRHLIEGTHATHIKPLSQLFAGEFLQPHSEGDFLQFS